MVTLDKIAPSAVPLTDWVQQTVSKTIVNITGSEAAYLGISEEQTPNDGIFGIISLVGDVSWSFVLGLAPETAVNLVLAFIDTEIEFDSEEMVDAVGEFANIMAGDLSARLASAGMATSLSLPTVARGHDLHLLLPSQLRSLPMSFGSSAGRFWVKVATGSPRAGRSEIT
jgi:CheY-specific phosphatase CheX